MKVLLRSTDVNATTVICTSQTVSFTSPRKQPKHYVESAKQSYKACRISSASQLLTKSKELRTKAYPGASVFLS